MPEITACRRIGNINDVMARWALRLQPGELRLTLQVLFAVRTREFEISSGHDRSTLLRQHSSCLHSML
jgi:hypothetical protein